MPVSGGRCEACQATLEWVLTEKRGKPMPLDIGEFDNGNVVLVETKDGLRARVFGNKVEPDVDGPRRRSHHSSCPRGQDRWLRSRPRTRR